MEDIENGCSDPKSCLYPDPNNCNGFIQCDDGGQVHHQQCSGGLFWNDRVKDCTGPNRFGCRF